MALLQRRLMVFWAATGGASFANRLREVMLPLCEGGDAAPLLSTGDAMPGALHLVLHSSVRETWTYCREFWATEMFERLKHT